MTGFFRRWRAARGTLPNALRAELEGEGLVLVEERIEGTVTYRAYEALGQRPRSGVQATVAALALTSKRLVVRGTQCVQLDAPPGILTVSDEAGELVLAYDAGDLYPTRSGSVELRLRTPRAAEIRARLQAWTETPSS